MRDILALPHLSGPHLSGPYLSGHQPFWAPTFLGTNLSGFPPFGASTLRGPSLCRHVGLKRHRPEQVWPKQVGPKYVNLAQSGTDLERYWPEAVLARQVTRAGLRWWLGVCWGKREEGGREGRTPAAVLLGVELSVET